MPLEVLRESIAPVLDHLYAMASAKPVGWGGASITRPNTVPPEQEKGDTVNCGIFMLMMLELWEEHEELEKFQPISSSIQQARQRLAWNLQKFDQARMKT